MCNMTVLEVIQRSTEFLSRKGVDSPRLQAELLLAHYFQMPRMRLYLDFERTLTPGEVEIVRELVKRRGQREPLQQIIGSTSFCGLEIAAEPSRPGPPARNRVAGGTSLAIPHGAGRDCRPAPLTCWISAREAAAWP